jgi:hypothetical protein
MTNEMVVDHQINIPLRKSVPEYETDFDDDFDYQLFKEES